MQHHLEDHYLHDYNGWYASKIVSYYQIIYLQNHDHLLLVIRNNSFSHGDLWTSSRLECSAYLQWELFLFMDSKKVADIPLWVKKSMMGESMKGSDCERWVSSLNYDFPLRFHSFIFEKSIAVLRCFAWIWELYCLNYPKISASILVFTLKGYWMVYSVVIDCFKLMN